MSGQIPSDHRTTKTLSLRNVPFSQTSWKLCIHFVGQIWRDIWSWFLVNFEMPNPSQRAIPAASETTPSAERGKEPREFLPECSRTSPIAYSGSKIVYEVITHHCHPFIHSSCYSYRPRQLIVYHLLTTNQLTVRLNTANHSTTSPFIQLRETTL
jgi:hypothetical protein